MFPIKYIENNLVFNHDGECFAYVGNFLLYYVVADVEYIADEIIVLKKGMILNKGTTDILLKEIQNHVWECFVNMDQINLFEDKFIVSNRKYTENGAVLRIVSTNQPALNAKKVEPSLEDLYLYYFREEGEN